MKDLFGNTTSLRDIQGEDYAGRIITETTDAILFNEGEKEVWLPLSHIRISNLRPAPKGERGQLAIVTIPDWLARKKGLIEGDGP